MQSLGQVRDSEITTVSGVVLRDERTIGSGVSVVIDRAPAVPMLGNELEEDESKLILELRVKHGLDLSEVPFVPPNRQQVNPAAGRGARFQCSPGIARAIMGEDFLAPAFIAGAKRTALGHRALRTVPFSTAELRAAKGRYVLVGVPEMTLTQLLDFAARKGLEVTENNELCAQDMEEAIVLAGWYLLKKTDAQPDRGGNLAMPRATNAFVLLFAAAAANASGTNPFGGSSSETTLDDPTTVGARCASIISLEDAEELRRQIRLTVLVNRTGGAYLRTDLLFRGRPMLTF